MADDWITTAQAAALTGYTPNYIRKLASTGRVLAKRWGRDWQISRASILAELETVRKKGKKRGPQRGI